MGKHLHKARKINCIKLEKLIVCKEAFNDHAYLRAEKRMSFDGVHNFARFFLAFALKKISRVFPLLNTRNR